MVESWSPVVPRRAGTARRPRRARRPAIMAPTANSDSVAGSGVGLTPKLYRTNPIPESLKLSKEKFVRSLRTPVARRERGHSVRNATRHRSARASRSGVDIGGHSTAVGGENTDGLCGRSVGRDLQRRG